MPLIAGIAATVFLSLEVRPATILNQREAIEMNWDRIGSWKQIKGNIIEQWDDLTEDQLASRIQETYGNSDDEAEYELTDWQLRLREIDRVA